MGGETGYGVANCGSDVWKDRRTDAAVSVAKFRSSAVDVFLFMTFHICKVVLCCRDIFRCAVILR